MGAANRASRQQQTRRSKPKPKPQPKPKSSGSSGGRSGGSGRPSGGGGRSGGGRPSGSTGNQRRQGAQRAQANVRRAQTAAQKRVKTAANKPVAAKQNTVRGRNIKPVVNTQVRGLSDRGHSTAKPETARQTTVRGLSKGISTPSKVTPAGTHKPKAIVSSNVKGKKTGAITKATVNRNNVKPSKRGTQIAEGVGYGLEYIGQKHKEMAAKIGESANKSAAARAGHGKGGSRGGVTGATKTDRLNASQKAAKAKQTAEQKAVETQAKTVKKNNYDNYYYTTASGKTTKHGKTDGVKAAGKIRKKAAQKADQALEKGAKNFSDDKTHEINIPIYTKHQQKKAKEEAKQVYTKAKNDLKDSVNASVKDAADSFDKEIKKLGYTSDTMLEIDGKQMTVAEYRAKMLKDVRKQANDSANDSLKDYRKELDKSTKDAGKVKLSNRDIYKGGVKLANEMVDYMVPYMATGGAAIKSAEAIVKGGRAVKAGRALVETAENGGKILTKSGKDFVRNALREGVKAGKSREQILKETTAAIRKADRRANFKTQLIANAMQDLSIGTGIDLAKGIDQNLHGKDMAKWMGMSAAMNAGIGLPMSAAIGRTSKAAKRGLDAQTKGAFDSAARSVDQEAAIPSLVAKARANMETATQPIRDRKQVTEAKTAIADSKARTTELKSQKADTEKQIESLRAKIDTAKKPKNKKQQAAAESRQKQLDALERKSAQIDDELKSVADTSAMEKKLRSEQMYHLPGTVEKYGVNSKQAKAVRANIEKLKTDIANAGRAVDSETAPKAVASVETSLKSAEAPRAEAPNAEAPKAETRTRESVVEDMRKVSDDYNAGKINTADFRKRMARLDDEMNEVAPASPTAPRTETPAETRTETPGVEAPARERTEVVSDMRKVAEDFEAGKINEREFLQKMDDHQKELDVIESGEAPKPGEAKNDLKTIEGMTLEELNKDIRGTQSHLKNAIKKYGEDSPRVKQLQDHLDEAEALRTRMQNEESDDLFNSMFPREGEKTAKDNTTPSSELKGIEVITHDPKDPGRAILPDDEINYHPPGSKAPKGAPGRTKPTKSAKDIKTPESQSSFSRMLSDKKMDIRRKWESSLVGFEHIAGKAKNAEMRQALRNQVTATYYWKNKAASWIEHGRAGMDRKVSGDGLNDIFKKAGLFGKKNAAKRADFCDYLTYQHAIDRLKYDKPVHMTESGGSQFTADEYRGMMKEIWDGLTETEQKELKTFEEDLNGYFRDLMQYRVDGGEVTEEMAKRLWEKYPHYVPTYRDGDDWLQGITTSIDDPLEQYLTRVPKSMQTATGGNAPIEDLYQQMVRLTRATIRDAEENKLMQTYAEAIGIPKDKIPPGATLDDVAHTAISATKDADGVYRVRWFQDGKPVEMVVDKNIAMGLREFNGQEYQRLLRFNAAFSKGTKWFKNLITDYNICFGVRNGARDFQQALVNSKDTKWFAASIPDALAAIARRNKDPYYKLYMANGGYHSTLVQSGKRMAEPGSEGAVRKGFNATGGKALKVLEEINSTIEINPRMMEFIGTIKKDANKVLEDRGISMKKYMDDVREEMYPGKSHSQLTDKEIEALEIEQANRIVDLVGKDTIDRAIHNSADITLNFSRNGAIGKALNLGSVPYFNPSIQGLSKTIRMFTEGHADKTLLNFLMKLGTITVAPAVLNEALLADDKNYQSLSTREKDSNFFISIGDGKYIKVPKPRENSVLAEPVGYGLRYAFDKAHVGVIEPGEYSGWKDLGQAFKSGIENIGPINPMSDNIFSPLVRLAQNKTWYGGSIESTSDILAKTSDDPYRRKKNSEIYDEKTSAWAKKIGQAKLGNSTVSDVTHLSPKKIDDVMDSYLGIIYDLGISQTADSTSGNPFVNQFVKDSVFSNKNGSELWAEFNKLNAPKTIGGKLAKKGKHFVFGNTIKGGIADGKTQEAQDWLNKFGYDDISYSDAIRKIEFDKDVPASKRKDYRRQIKIWQNDLRRQLVYGDKDIKPKQDPVRKISSIVGVDKAMKDYTFTYTDPKTGEKKNQHLDAWNAYKKSGEYKKDSKAAGDKFIDFYSKMRWTNGRIGEAKSFPQWMTASVIAACSKGNNDALAKAYIRPDYGDGSKDFQEKVIQRGKNYKDYGFDQAYYRKSQKRIHDTSRKLGNEYTSGMNPWDSAMALATDKKNNFLDGAYYTADTSGKVSRRMNAARCLGDKGYHTKEINNFAKKHKLELPESGSSAEEWRAFDDKVARAVKKDYGDRSAEEQAAIYQVITDDYKNPFGEIGNYGKKGDTGITDLDARNWSGGGWGRRGRRGWHRRGWGRGGWGGGSGGGGGATPLKFDVTKGKTTKAKNSHPSANAKSFGKIQAQGMPTPEAMPRPKTTKAKASKAKVSNVTTSAKSAKSGLDEAYRRKVLQMYEANRRKLY